MIFLSFGHGDNTAGGDRQPIRRPLPACHTPLARRFGFFSLLPCALDGCGDKGTAGVFALFINSPLVSPVLPCARRGLSYNLLEQHRHHLSPPSTVHTRLFLLVNFRNLRILYSIARRNVVSSERFRHVSFFLSLVTPLGGFFNNSLYITEASRYRGSAPKEPLNRRPNKLQPMSL